MGRPPCCDKSNVKRGLWTPEEDAKILAYVSNHGVGNWTLVPKKAGLNRCGKSCRLRWTNYLRPDLRHDGFSVEEEELIINLHQAIGSRWSLIAKRLPGRTDNDVKNYWNTKLRKKLMTKGIDPITHKPFSQIFYDYGNISGLPNPTGPARPFNRNFNPELSQPILAFPNQNPVSSPPEILHFQTVTQESIQQHFLDEVTSSCSSSSACNVTQLNSPDHSSFAWSQFLLHDNFLQRDPQSLSYERLKAYRASPMAENEHGLRGGVGEEKSFTALNSRSSSPKPTQSKPSSAVNSFIDTMLDRDDEIRAVFPEILEEYFD